MRIGLIIFLSLIFYLKGTSQIVQTHRYELEKKNTDKFFTVLPSGEDGVIIFRETDEYKKGNIWQITSLDTTLTERWQSDLALHSKYIFKGYDLTPGKLHLLFREGEYEKKDYQLISIDILSGETERFDIENEIPLRLSHITMLSDRLILGGYVNFSPTIVHYPFGGEGFEVVPGFFKDRSMIVDMRDNGNSTFNTVTIENDYLGNFLRVRTYSYDGDILFEREVKLEEGYKVLGAKTSGFIDGNIIVSGTYGIRKSNYAVGVYFVVVKPEGQENLIKFYDFSDFQHFFDYMPEKRSERVRERMAKRVDSGKDFHFPSRLVLHDIIKTDKGFLMSAELFDPEYQVRNTTLNGFENQQQMEKRSMASQSYAKQPSRLLNVDDAVRFEYLESIVFELDKKGKLIWDNSMKIEDTELFSLEQVVHITQHLNNVHMVYRSEEDIHQKTIGADSVFSLKDPIKLVSDNDEITHTYNGVGRSENWYENNFIVWGYHKIENEVDADEKIRKVLYVNKLVIK